MLSVKDKTAKNDSQIFESTNENLSLESNNESNRFDGFPTPYGFDNKISKSDILDNSTMAHALQNPCGRDINKFFRSSYDKESTNPPKDFMVVFVMGQIKFLGEIKIKNNIKCLLTLKSVFHDNQLSSYNF